MKLVSVYDETAAPSILYALLSERPQANWISHEVLPSFGEHSDFVAGKPFRYWYLIWEGEYIGMLEVTDRNELGIQLFTQFHRKGYAARALNIFLYEHEPLPPIPAIRNGHWLANVAVGNDASKAFFKYMKFKPLQETYIYG